MKQQTHSDQRSRLPQNDASNSTQRDLTGSAKLQNDSSKNKPAPLPAAISGAQFLPAIERLCSAKNTVQLTPHAAETWVAAFSLYSDRPKLVNRALVELAVSDDPFPDLSKLLAKCEYLRRVADKTLPQDSTKIAFRDVTGLARAWGIEV